ncbi:hypothetical protein [Aquimarina algiphila]|uniref:hypothetical protein n=1 Tax=Aquimarina algiphila TaxID=2047982 RepID=UPI00232DD0F4|nr:hypothetical protein [Aquimarina algiphila]
MKNLENFGVQELTIKEQETTEGGILGLFVLVAVAGFLWGLGQGLEDKADK